MYVILVDWVVQPDKAEWFYLRLLGQAEDSLAQEPQCHRFDVSRHETDTGRFLLYEIYTDRAAFDHHLKSAHFASFSADADPVTLSKDVSGWSL